jgi:MFS transporter, DHA1 family, multidrug resistance protein
MPRGRTHLLLAYVAGSYGFGFQAMYQFLLPLRARELGAPVELIGVLVGLGAVVPAVLSVTSGELADRFGSRNTYVAGALVSTVCALLFVPLTSYWAMLPIQVVIGFARSTAWIASQSYVSHLGSPAEQPTHMGRLSFATNGGTLLAPLIIGAAAQAVGYRDAFLVAAFFSLVYVVIGLTLPDVRAAKRTRAAGGAGFGTALRLMRTRGMQVALMLSFVRLWSSTAWRAFFPLYLASNGFPPALIGTVLSANSAVSTVVTLTAGWVTRVLSPALATAAALALGALGMAISPHLAVMPLVYLPALLTGTAVGLSLPLLMATVSTEAAPEERGVALGLRMSANQAASAISPTAIGVVVGAFGIALGFATSALICWVILAAAAWLHVSQTRLRA